MPEVSNGLMKRVQPRLKKRQYRRTFIREWRQHRNMTLEQLGERLEMTASHLSMLERGERGYTQETLEAIADALMTDAASLLMRDPTREDADYSLWDQALPAERKLTLEILKTVRKTGS